MKCCGYCGRENMDEAAACCECGTSFLPPSDQPTRLPEGWTQPAPSKRSKLNLLGAAWSIASLAMLPLGMYLPYVGLRLLYAFPSGLWCFSKYEASSRDVALGWATYTALMTAVMLARKRWLFILFYVALCVMLAVNVPGCYKVVNTIGRDLKCSVPRFSRGLSPDRFVWNRGVVASCEVRTSSNWAVESLPNGVVGLFSP